MRDTKEPFKVKITIEIETSDQDEISPAIDQAIEGIRFGAAEGQLLMQSGGKCTYKIEDNLPRKPFTVDTMFKLYNEERAPGTPTLETLLELTMSGGEEAAAWWDSLTEAERYQWLTQHEHIRAPSEAWEEYRRQQDGNAK